MGLGLYSHHVWSCSSAALAGWPGWCEQPQGRNELPLKQLPGYELLVQNHKTHEKLNPSPSESKPRVLLQRWGVALFVISSMVPLSTFVLIGSCEWWAGDTCLGPGCWGRRNSQAFSSRNGTLPTITKWGALLKAGVGAPGGLSKCETGRHWYLFI